MRPPATSATPGRPGKLDVTFATFVRALAAIAVAWIAWQLLAWALVFVLAIFLAVAFDPAVAWLERRGLRRGYGAPLLVAGLLLVCVGFFLLSAASLSEDARQLGTRAMAFRDEVLQRLPAEARPSASWFTSAATWIASLGTALLNGFMAIGVALILTLYLLLDGRRTYDWLVAFAPEHVRPQVHETAHEARKVVGAFIQGNLITSLLAGVCTWVALVFLQVPAALLLAVLAGVLDLIPIIGFFLSAAPAVLLGFAVSPAVALAVAAFYVLYNLVEAYYIQPKVFGRTMCLSDLAVVAAFLVGAQLAGVIGAVIALPLAALYPIVERVWFDRPGLADTADEHARIEAQPEH